MIAFVCVGKGTPMLQHKCDGEKTISRVLSLLPLCWPQEPDPGPQDWLQVPSHCEPAIKKLLKAAFLQRKKFVL